MKILIVDDEAHLRDLLTARLEHWGYRCRAAGGVREAESIVDVFDPDIVLSDVVMPEATGIDLLRRLRGAGRPVVLMTAHGNIDTAVDAMKEGALDFLTKPLDNARLHAVLERAASARLCEEEGPLSALVGECAAMRELRRLITMVAPSDASAIITGESGTGKELVARAIHEMSTRHGRPWVAVNAAAIPEGLVESELFGHERGAFTGAVRSRAGCFEQASGGTLFLDELAEMPLSLQPKLLRVLESGRVRRLGGTQEIPIDVRVIAATNRDPLTAVQQGMLREDLYYRLNVFEVRAPPLRDRRDDLPLLAQHFVHEANGRNGTTVRGLGPGAVERLRAHRWPGNVRELRNLVERAVILAGRGWLEAEHFPALRAEAEAPEVIVLPLGTTAAEAERRLILKTLEATDNNKAEAARRLGLDVKTIRNKLKDA